VNEDALEGSEFYLALRVLDAMAVGMPQDRLEITLQLIWKRCYIYDADTWNTLEQSEDVKATIRHTAVWRTLELALDDGFFDRFDCYVRYLAPTECLGAGCRAQDLDFRWSNPDILDPILADNRTHDEQLGDFLATQRLDKWMQSLFKDATSAFLERAEQKSEALDREREFERTFVEGKKLAINGVDDVHEDVEEVGLEEIYGPDDGEAVEESGEFDGSAVEESGLEEESGVDGVEGEEDEDVEMG